MTNISSAAQAVLDAWESQWSKGSFCHEERSIAAALRAAACQLTTARSIDKLRAIADELEGVKYGTYRCDLNGYE
jgi:hypothetical protein